ncbi:MAG: MATE family efflux transporter [Kiritimatiellae bacterium]|nr:MATE family efflux transporter [Kiritimatiellia bacterium]
MSKAEKERVKNLTPGGYAEMWRIAGPLIMSMGSYTIMQFCDRVFLSRYSSVSIQAALPAGILAHTLICFFQSLCGYSSTFTAQYYGAGDFKRCVESTFQGLWLALASWPFILLLIPLGLWLLGLTAHSEAVLAAEKPYFTILMVGGFVLPLNAVLGGYFMGVGRTRINLLANVIGCSLNVLLNYIFIFGKWGVPEMGIHGAAYATVISAVLTAVIQWVVFVNTRAVKQYKLRELLGVNLPLMGRIVHFGSQSGLHLLMEIGSFSVFIMLTGKLGALALTASNIAFSINNLAFSPLLGFGLAASTLVAQHKGAGNQSAAARSGMTATKMALIYMLVVGATFLLLPRFYFELFNPKDAAFSPQELLSVGRVMLVIMTFWGLFDVVTIVLGDALKGAGDTRFVLLFLSLSGWVLMIPGAVLLLYYDRGIIALWTWLAAYILLAAIGTAWRWHSGRWKRIQVIESRIVKPLLPITDEVH